MEVLPWQGGGADEHHQLDTHPLLLTSALAAFAAACPGAFAASVASVQS